MPIARTALALQLVLLGPFVTGCDKRETDPPASGTPAKPSVPVAAPKPAPSAAGTKVLDEPTFTVSVPADWQVEAKNDDGHLNVSINHPTNYCRVQFIAGPNRIDPDRNVKMHAVAQVEDVYKGVAERTTFDKWGPLSGSGVLLRGKKLGTQPGFTRMFAARVKKGSMIIYESCFDDDAAAMQIVFDAVRATFVEK